MPSLVHQSTMEAERSTSPFGAMLRAKIPEAALKWTRSICSVYIQFNALLLASIDQGRISLVNSSSSDPEKALEAVALWDMMMAHSQGSNCFGLGTVVSYFPHGVLV